MLHFCCPSVMLVNFRTAWRVWNNISRKKRNHLINTVHMTCFLEKGIYSFSPNWRICLPWPMYKLVYEEVCVQILINSSGRGPMCMLRFSICVFWILFYFFLIFNQKLITGLIFFFPSDPSIMVIPPYCNWGTWARGFNYFSTSARGWWTVMYRDNLLKKGKKKTSCHTENIASFTFCSKFN